MRLVLVLAVIVGMALCTRGIGRIAAAGDWLHPIAMLGYALGALALLYGFAGFTRRTILFVSDEKHALLAIALIIGAKYVLGWLYTSLQKSV